MTEEMQAPPESLVIEGEDHGPAPTAQLPEDKPKEEKPLSRRESIEASLSKIEKTDAAPELEAKPEDKPAEVKAEDKPKEAEPAPEADVEKDEAVKTPQQADGDKSSSEDDKSSPPARIAEDAKKFWRSTPRAMKAEFARLEGEITRITQESGEAIALHEELRDLNQLAKQHGTSIKAAMQTYINAENAFRHDFGSGAKNLATTLGMQPQDVITSVLKAYGVSPQQFAQAVTQNPQAFAPKQTLQSDPAIQQLMQSQQQMNEWIKQQEQAKIDAQKEAAITEKQRLIDEWAADKPDFNAKEGAIAEILRSGIIERIYGKGLTDLQRVDAAYRMAGGSGASVPQEQMQPAPVPPVTPPVKAEGNLSITGAPGNGKDPTPSRAKPKSRRESIEAAMARLTA